jgi:hypothetical protein
MLGDLDVAKDTGETMKWYQFMGKSGECQKDREFGGAADMPIGPARSGPLLIMTIP